ncbi:MAG TPA: hypothetical protein VFJ61_10125 [Solirubrobacterales bacterium]|nr:hypothetical protein [Solirubrobacterales bacterium]
MKATHTFAALGCALALLALPTGAGAKPGYYVNEANRSATIHLHGTHGYQIDVSGSAGFVSVTAFNRDASVLYFVSDRGLKGDHLRARLPGVGRIDLRFKERKRSQHPPRGGCKGSPTLIRGGVFEGWLRIRGERGYTHTETHRVRGKIVQEPETTCRERGSARTSSAPDETISAEAPRGDGQISFHAYRFPSTGFDAVLFTAGLARQRGKMVVVNSRSAVSKDAEDLVAARPPRSATVEPPGPFTGSAAFLQESKEDFSWSGDLAVELPGVGEVGLAGPHWKSSLCIGRSCRGDGESGESFTTVAIAR